MSLAPPTLRLERVLPALVTGLGLALLLAGGFCAVRAEAAIDPTVTGVAFGPFTLSRGLGRRLVMLGVVLLVGRLLLWPLRRPEGGVASLVARMPAGVRFPLGVWATHALAVKLFTFLGLLWLPHPHRGRMAVGRLWVEPLCRDWDAAWYQSIAFDGYSMPAERLSNVAFFPLYPLLVRAAAVIVRDPCWSAWAVSQAALLGALLGVYRLSRVRLGDDESARWALVLQLSWPFAFFLGASYTEALFLCLAVWSFIAAEARRFWVAGVLGALAAATRLTGVMLLPALLLVGAAEGTGPAGIVGACRAALKDARARIGLLLVPLGTLSYFGYLAIRFGDFWANLRAAREGWGRGPGKGSHDVTAAAGAVFQLDLRPESLVLTVHLVLALALVPVLRRLPARHGWGYTAFVMGIALPGAVSGLEAFGRYMAPAFPLVWVLAPAARAAPTRAAWAVLVAVLFQALFLFLHAHGAWIT